MRLLEAISLKVYGKEASNVKQWFKASSHFSGAGVNRKIVAFSLRSKSVLTALLPAGRQAQEGPVYLLLHRNSLECLFS